MALAGAGARVAVVGRNTERGLRRVKEIEGIGGRAIFVKADVSSKDMLLDARSEIEGKLGVVAILVNAAGGNSLDATLPPGGDFTKLSRDAWNDVFNQNLVGGTLLPSQVFGEAMLEAADGSIVNIASMAGMIPLSRVVAYSAAKSAVINLTRFLAREWADKGVRVNAISPGFFPAEQNSSLLFDGHGDYSDRGNQIVSHTPMRRFGKPEELAGVVVWLASRAASGFVTGQNIVVDGGFSSSTI
jgi:NAD(P)-dependent dehydrogenase (short-subunit alcohol dehydrogenase family)